MVTAASSSLRGSSVPGLPLMVLGGLLHRSRSWRGAVLTLHSLVGLLYRPSWLHIYLVPAALLGTRALHQNARACPGAGPYALTTQESSRKAGESQKAAQKATKTQRASRYAIARDDAWPAREQVGADAARTKTRPLGKVSFFSFGVTSARRGGAMTDELKGKDRGAGDGPCTGQAKG